PLAPVLTPPFNLPIDIVFGVIFVIGGSFGVFAFGFAVLGVRVFVVVLGLLVQILLATIEPALDALVPVLATPFIVVVLWPRDAGTDDSFTDLAVFGVCIFVGGGGFLLQMVLPFLNYRFRG